MNRIIDLIVNHPAEIAIAAVVGICGMLIVLTLLRVRFGFPWVLFGCLFVILAGSSSFGHLQQLSKGVFRWAALATVAGSSLFYLHEFDKPLNRFTSIHIWSVALLLFAAATAPFGVHSRFSVLSVLSVALLFLGAFGTVWGYASDSRRLMEIARLYAKLALVIVGLGFAFIVLPGAATSVSSRFMGFFNNPNWNGNFSAILLPLVMWTGRYGTDRIERRIFSLLVIVMAVNILLSGSRGAILGGTVAGFLALSRLDPERLTRRLILIVPIVLLVMLTQYGREHLGSHAERLARVERLRTLTHRTEMWQEAWPEVRRNLPLGMGLGNSRFILMEDEAEQAATGVGATTAHIHSQHVLMIAELGIPGIVMLWIFFMMIGVMGLRLWVMPRSPTTDLAFVGVCSCAMVMADSFIHGWMLSAGSPFALLFWSLVAVTFKADRLGRAEVVLSAWRTSFARPAPTSVTAAGGV